MDNVQVTTWVIKPVMTGKMMTQVFQLDGEEPQFRSTRLARWYKAGIYNKL